MDRDALTVMPESGPVPGSVTATPLRKAADSFRALRSIPFRLYFGGQIVSASGTFLQQTAIGWLVLERTRSPGDLGLVLAAGGIPSLILGPWGGAVADRVDLRKLLIATQTLYCLLAGLLWVLALDGDAGVTMLLIIGVAGGFVQIADSPARQAFVSRLVSPDDLASAVSLNGVVVNSARVVGPAFCFVTLCSTTLQLHSSSAFRGRIMALWVFVYLGTTPIGSILTGGIISAGGPMTALLVGSGACFAAALLAAFVHTPANPDALLTDLGT